MRVRPLIPLLLAGALAAQDTAVTHSPLRFVPADCPLVVCCDGAAKWREAFADTRLASLLAGPTLGPLFDEFGQQLEKLREAARQESSLDIDRIERAVTEYSGQAVFALHVDFEALASTLRDDGPPPVALLLALGPDGHTDLAGLADMLLAELEKSGDLDLRDVQLAGRTVRVAAGDEAQVALPFVEDGTLLLLGSPDLERFCPKFLDVEHPLADAAWSAGALTMRIDVAGGLRELLRTAQRDAEPELPFDMIQLVDEFGLGAMGPMSISVGADADFVRVDVNVPLTTPQRGVWGVYGQPGDGRPRLLSLVPGDAENYSAQTIDLGAVYRTLANLWRSLEDDVPVSLDQAEAMFAEATKVRLHEDLIAHLGRELLTIQDPEAQAQAIAAAESDDTEPGLGAMMAGNLFALSLADGRAFGDSLEKLIRSRGLHVSRKSEEYQGVKVYRMNLLGLVHFEYAVTEDLLLVQLGEPGLGRQLLRAVLDLRADQSAGKPAPELAADVRERLERLPGGWNGIGVSSTQAMLKGFSSAFMAGLAAAGPVRSDMAAIFGRTEAVLTSLSRDLREFGLGTMVSTSYVDRDGVRFSMRW